MKTRYERCDELVSEYDKSAKQLCKERGVELTAQRRKLLDRLVCERLRVIVELFPDARYQDWRNCIEWALDGMLPTPGTVD